MVWTLPGRYSMTLTKLHTVRHVATGYSATTPHLEKINVATSADNDNNQTNRRAVPMSENHGSRAEQEGRAEHAPARDPREVPAHEGHEQRPESERVKHQTKHLVNRDARHKDESVPRHTTKQHERPEQVGNSAAQAAKAKDGDKAH